MDFELVREATLKYDKNTKWVFLFQDVKTRDFFVDFVWDELETGSLHDLIEWTPASSNGFQNSITKIGGSKNGKNVLLVRDLSAVPKPKVNFGRSGLDDYVRGLAGRDEFRRAARDFEGSEFFSKDGDWPATIKSGLIGEPVNGTAIVARLLKKCVTMLLSARQPGDERELSAFYVGSSADDGELSADSSIAAAVALLKKHGYEVRAPVRESVPPRRDPLEEAYAYV